MTAARVRLVPEAEIGRTMRTDPVRRKLCRAGTCHTAQERREMTNAFLPLIGG
jgi:hypothetical protein